ncbi:unnamed protein product [Ambrosiozyma monospora]|uniref:Unnamed protein product n=1 Tax=Ambrosiozyma monospora TaxID=43982 RepID=A0A9W7DCH8_AMBMO|nr:unnamed protein product [Ambrosiozyma monospora]
MSSTEKHTTENDFSIARKKQKTIDEQNTPETSSDSVFSDLEEYETNTNPSTAHINYDLYLETINRKVLDFTYPKICSVSLKTTSIYSCLTCSKYFQGRSTATPAYRHSIDLGHHVFANLTNLKFYILPENYEVKGAKALESLNDIKKQISPSYNDKQIVKLNQPDNFGIDLNGDSYVPGFVGLTNMNGQLDYANVLVLALSHVSNIRDFFLTWGRTMGNCDDGDEIIYDRSEFDLCDLFGLTVRKLWFDHLFKKHLSTSELMHLIEIKSNGKFGNSGEAHNAIAGSSNSVGKTGHKSVKDFFVWLVNNLNAELKNSGLKSTILTKNIQGKLENENDKTKKTIKFWYLTIQLPSQSLFKDSQKPVVEQFELNNLLKKLPFRIVKTPKVLILHIDRDTTKQEIIGINHLNENVVRFDPDCMHFSGKKYRLITNIIIVAASEMNSDGLEQLKIRYKVQLLDKTNLHWYEIDDLKVEKIQKEFLEFNLTSLQFWETL